MYSWIWRRLPGPAWVRVIYCLALLLLVLAALNSWVFPWINQMLEEPGVTVG